MRSSLAQMVAATADYNRRLLQPVACLDKAPSSGSSTEQPVLAMSLVATASAIDIQRQSGAQQSATARKENSHILHHHRR